MRLFAQNSPIDVEILNVQGKKIRLNQTYMRAICRRHDEKPTVVELDDFLELETMDTDLVSLKAKIERKQKSKGLTAETTKEAKTKDTTAEITKGAKSKDTTAETTKEAKSKDTTAASTKGAKRVGSAAKATKAKKPKV